MKKLLVAMALAGAMAQVACADTITWSDGEKGGTLSFGADASGDNTLQLPQQDYETQVKQLDFFAGSGGTLTVDGGTSGWSFGMPATEDEYSYTTYPFNINGAEKLFSVWRQTIYQQTWPAASPQAELTNAQFRVTRDGTKSELHIDGGVWNTDNPYGCSESTAVAVFGAGTGDSQLESRVYVHAGAALKLGYSGYSAQARDVNLLQFDGGTQTFCRPFCFFIENGAYPDVARTGEMVVTGSGTVLNFLNAFYWMLPVNGGPGMSVPGNHGNDTMRLVVANGAAVNIAGSMLTGNGAAAACEIVLTNGATLAAASITSAANFPTRLVMSDSSFTAKSFGSGRSDSFFAVTNSMFDLTALYNLMTFPNIAFDNVDFHYPNLQSGASASYVKGGTFTSDRGCNQGTWFGNATEAGSRIVFDGAAVNLQQRFSVGYNATYCKGCVVLTNGTELMASCKVTLGEGAGTSGRIEVRRGSKMTGSGIRIGQASETQGALLVDGGDVLSKDDDQVGVSGDGLLQIIGGSFTNLSSRDFIKGVKLGVNAGSTGTVELGEGGLLRTAFLTGGSGTSKLVADGGTMTPEVKYNTVNQPTTEARQERFIYGLTSAEVGAKGLTITSPWTTPITVEQAFADLPDAQGRLVLTGTGAKKLTGANTCSLIRVEEGDATVASAGSTVQAVGAGRLLLGDGAATAVTYGGLILGEESTGGILAVDSSDVITTTAAPVFNKVYLALCDVPANGTYPLVKTAAAVDAAAKAGWAGAYLYAGRQDGKMYAFTVTEAEGVTSFNVVIGDARALDPSLVKKYNGAGGVVTVDDVEAVDAVEFDSQSSYSVGGDGLFAFNDTGAGYVKSLLGSHLLGIGLVLPGTTEFYVEEGTELEVSGNIQNGAVRKTGLGRLTLTGEGNAFMDEMSVEGGIVRFENSGALGYNAAARSNAIVMKRGTVEFESDEDAAVSGRSLVIDATNGKSVVADVKTPLTLGGMDWTSGAFIKRGAGKLTVEFDKASRIAGSGAAKSAETYSTSSGSFPENGDGLANYFGGFNVCEGELELKGPADLTVSSDATMNRIGLNTPDGVVNPTLTLNGVYLYNVNGHLLCGYADKSAFARDYTLRIINGGKIVCLSFGMRGYEDEEGLGSSQTHVSLENGGQFASYGSFSTYSSAVCPTYVSVTGGSKMCADGYSFNSPFALTVVDSRICKSGGYAMGTDATNMKFGFNAVGAADLRNADFRINGLSRAPKTTGKTDFGNGQVTLDFDGTTWWPKASDVSLAVQEAETFTLNVKSGGLVVSNDSGKVFSTAKAFTGTGRIVKAGAGTLAFGRNVTIKGDGATGTETVELDRTYTMDAEGGLEIREGTVQLAAGSIRPDAAVEVAEGGTLDLGGNEIRIGGLSGAGRVVNGILKNSSLGFDAGSEGGFAFENCAFAGKTKVVVTGAQPELGKTYRIGTWDGTGASPDGESWKVIGCGSSVRMQVSVKDGVLTGTFSQVGLSVIVR